MGTFMAEVESDSFDTKISEYYSVNRFENKTKNHMNRHSHSSFTYSYVMPDAPLDVHIVRL